MFGFIGTKEYLFYIDKSAILMPKNLSYRRTLESRKLLNKLPIFKHTFVKNDTIKNGSIFPKSPELLPLKEKNFSHVIY